MVAAFSVTSGGVAHAPGDRGRTRFIDRFDSACRMHQDARIAPQTYRADETRPPVAQSRRNAELRAVIARVDNENHFAHGPRDLGPPVRG